MEPHLAFSQRYQACCALFIYANQPSTPALGKARLVTQHCREAGVGESGADSGMQRKYTQEHSKHC